MLFFFSNYGNFKIDVPLHVVFHNKFEKIILWATYTSVEKRDSHVHGLVRIRIKSRNNNKIRFRFTTLNYFSDLKKT